MLNRLTDPNPERKKWPVDAELFLELAVPETLAAQRPDGRALIEERAVRSRLVDGWRLAYAGLPPETWQPHAERWFHRAAKDDRHRDLLLSVLVDAGQLRADILARLYTMTRAPGLRASVSEPLLAKINVAQSVRFHMTPGTEGGMP
jgi:hypothetical protein